jgi:uncharacterized protein (DUF885 family)
MPSRHPIIALSDEIVDELASLFPDLATFQGVEGHDHHLPDLSPEGAAAALAAQRSLLARVEGLPPATDRWDRLAVEVARSILTEEIDHYEQGDHLVDLNSLSSPAQGLREVFDHMRRDTRDQWATIVDRLRCVPQALEGYRRSLDAGLEAGRPVARRQAEAAMTQAGVHASDDTSAFASLVQEIDGSRAASALHGELDDASRAARVAFGEFGEYLRTEYLPRAEPVDAVGRERYVRQAHRFLGTDIDPEATYAWGWDEVADLRSALARVADGIAPGAGVPGALETLTGDPDRRAPDPATFCDMMQQRIDEALSQLDGTHFEVPPQIRTTAVKLAPPGGALGAYYVGPSEDFTRQGTVWWALASDGPVPLFDQVTTAYHEGFPGHHLQVGMQVSLADRLSRLHRLWLWKPGIGEGWALYAERLMHDLGFLDRPDYVFGYLAAQLHRACRVVIDIGSHLQLPIPDGQAFHPGEAWTFETATEMLRDYATLEPDYAESEVTRYLGWPGQAIAYKVGEQFILDTREELRRRRGAAFDPATLHRDYLEVGPVGIDLMREMLLGAS